MIAVTPNLQGYKMEHISEASTQPANPGPQKTGVFVLCIRFFSQKPASGNIPTLK